MKSSRRLRALCAIMVICLEMAPLSYAEHIRGQIIVGTHVYDLTGDLVKINVNSMRIHYAISDGSEEIRRVDGVLSTSSWLLIEDGRALIPDSSMFILWAGQLFDGMWRWQRANGFRLLKETADSLILESPNTIALAGFLEAKIRLVYLASDLKPNNPFLLSCKTSENRKLRLASISLFSLAEWRNGFEEYTSMILFFEP